MKLIYLVQGEARLIKNFMHLLKRKDVDCILMTFDHKISEAIYFPNSTWAEGRNILLRLAHLRSDYDYYIFVDDDTVFTRGNFEAFEQQIQEIRPGIGVPIVPKTRNSEFIVNQTKWPYQNFALNDEQLIAFHKDIINEEILVPYVTQFDHMSWWAACEIQQILIQSLYRRVAIQFNNIEIANTESLRYGDHNDHSFASELRRELKKIYTSEYKEYWHFISDPNWKGFDLNQIENNRSQYSNIFLENFYELLQLSTEFRKKSSSLYKSNRIDKSVIDEFKKWRIISEREKEFWAEKKWFYLLKYLFNFQKLNNLSKRRSQFPTH